MPQTSLQEGCTPVPQGCGSGISFLAIARTGCAASLTEAAELLSLGIWLPVLKNVLIVSVPENKNCTCS